MLRTTKPTRIVFVLVAAVAVLSVGYIMALAILAPEQLAEATTAATDLICSGCVGTTDIASNAVTSAKIGSGQVKNSDLGPSAVTSPKIADGQVGNGDLGTDAVYSAKIKNGEVKPKMYKVQGSEVTIAPNTITSAQADCPPGYSITGGGFASSNFDVRVADSSQGASETWIVTALNPTGFERSVTAYALCIGPSP